MANQPENRSKKTSVTNQRNSYKLIGLIVIILIIIWLIIKLFTGGFGGITDKAVFEETRWSCGGSPNIKANFTKCDLPENYTADTGFTEVYSATCEEGWVDYSMKSSNQSKIIVGICKQGKCVSKYGKDGIVRLTGSNNICPVGSWNY